MIKWNLLIEDVEVAGHLHCNEKPSDADIPDGDIVFLEDGNANSTPWPKMMYPFPSKIQFSSLMATVSLMSTCKVNKVPSHVPICWPLW
jgi:hypothetical protein